MGWGDKLIRRDKEGKKVRPSDLSPAGEDVSLKEIFSPAVLTIDPDTPILKNPVWLEPIEKFKKPAKFYKHDDKALHIIKFVRESKEISQAKMAAKLGLTTTGYYNIEHGKTRMLWTHMRKICEILEIKLTINGEKI